MVDKTILDLTLINNLSDAVSIPIHDTTQTYRATLKQLRMLLVPAGSIFHFAQKTVPGGFLWCNGQAVDRIVYADLFAEIGITYGAGDGVNTFNIPDYRGEFLRGANTSGDVGSSHAYKTGLPQNSFTGSTSSDGGHTHTRGTMNITGEVGYSTTIGLCFTNAPSTTGAFALGASSANGLQANTSVTANRMKLNAASSWSGSTSSNGNHTHTTTVTGGGDSETSPQHKETLICIKY